MSKKYNHMMDMAFEIETDEKVWYNIPKSKIVEAVLRRITDVLREETNVGETFSRLSTYEIEEHKDKYYESYPNHLPRLMKEIEDRSERRNSVEND
jgi:hypothetical protein